MWAGGARATNSNNKTHDRPAPLALRSRRLTRLRHARGATVHDCTRNDTSIHSAGVNARGAQDSAVLPLLSPPFGWLSLAAARDRRLTALAVRSGRQLIYCIAVEARDTSSWYINDQKHGAGPGVAVRLRHGSDGTRPSSPIMTLHLIAVEDRNPPDTSREHELLCQRRARL